jgi:hypothetical protein
MAGPDTPRTPDTRDDVPETWAALLAHCADLAQAAVALPPDADGARWKKAVPHVITLQSMTLALTDLDRIDGAERSLALDKAEIACREASASLHAIWRDEPMPGGIDELIHDARVAFEAAANAGLEWSVVAERFVFEAPEALIERLRRSGFAGELFLPAPGVALFRGCPCVFARAPGGAPPAGEHLKMIEEAVSRPRGAVGEPARVAMPRQAYRQMDFGSGRAVRDVVLPMNEPLPPGQPLLVLAIDGGSPCPLPPPFRGAPMAGAIPVTFEA